jgi:hypothetical protein
MLAVLCLGMSQVAFIFGSEDSVTLQNATVIDEDATVAGDLILDGGRSLRVENCSLDVEGRVSVSDGSRLILKDAKIRLIESGQADSGVSGYWFDIRGDSILEAVNVTIETTSFHSFRIRVSDSASMRFRGVYSMEWYGLTCDGDSSVAVEDSTCWSMFHMGGSSALEVSDSRIFGVNVTDAAEACLDGVYATSASASGGGSLTIRNSTIGSDTRGLELRFEEGTGLTIAGFPASPTGIGYWYCDHWSLQGDNDVASSALNITLVRVYLRHMRLNVDMGADVRVMGVDAPLEITCRDDSLEVADSSIGGIGLEHGCALSAEYVGLSWFEASMDSSATFRESEVQRSESHNSSVVSYSSSVVGSLSGGEGAVIILCNSSLPEQLRVDDDSVVIHYPRPASATLLGYDVDEGELELVFEPAPVEGAELTVVLNRGRVVQRSDLRVLLDGEAVDYEVLDEKDLSYVRLQLPPGVSRLSVLLGASHPERVPFLQTLFGQRLVTLLLITLLVVFVLLTWR